MRYSDASTAMVPSAAEQKALNAAMDNVVGSLNWGLTKLKIKLNVITAATYVTGAGLLVLTPEAVSGIKSSFPTLEAIIARLNSTSRQRVMAGELAADKWLASANEVRKGIESIGKEVQELSVSSLVNKQFNDAVNQIKKILSDTATFGGWTLPILGVGAILVSVLVLPKVFGGPTINIFSSGRKRR